MAVIFFTAFLWITMAAMGTIALRKGDGSFAGGLRDGARESLFILPRVTVGVFGAAFFAELLPKETISAFLGSGSGTLGILFASAAGPLIVGGPVVSFAVAGAALEAGAGIPQVMAFVTGWLLFSSSRTIVWELPVMGARFVGARLLLCLPIPPLVGHLALLFGG